MKENSEVHPEILDGLEYETQFIQRTAGAGRRDVNLKRGDAWLLRFLPVKLGASKRFYARIAKHWRNKQAVVCPRMTEGAYGGDPNAFCPVCELSDQLNSDRNEDIRNYGFKLRSNANWITWCVVFEKSSNGGTAQKMPLPEILLPYQFQHYRSTWEHLTGLIRQGTRRAKDSVLDLEKGNDFWAAKGAKGMTLDKQDSGPIFDLDDPKFDDNVAKIMAACKEPGIKIPSEKTLDDFASKAEEEASNLASGSRRPSHSHGRSRPVDDEDDVPYDEPKTRRSAPVEEEEEAPTRSRRSEPADEEEDDQSPRGRRSAPVEDDPPARTERSSRRAAPQTEEEEEAPRTSSRRSQPASEEQPASSRRSSESAEPPPAPGRRSAPADDNAEQNPPPRSTRPSSRGAAPVNDPPAAPARRSAPAQPVTPPRATASVQESLDEDDNVPEEANDQAPPAAEEDSGAVEAPPAVSRRGALGADMKSRISEIQNSAKK